MEIIIEHTIDAGAGAFGDLLHFPDTSLEIFSLDSGTLGGRPSQKIGESWSSAMLGDRENVTPGTGLTHFNVDVLSGFGAIGAVSNGAKQQLLIYEFAHDLSEYLAEGRIEAGLGRPVRTFQLQLENPPDESGARLNVAEDEAGELVAPGAKVIFAFRQGDDGEEIELGAFYADRSDYRVKDPRVAAEGRNLIGKALAEQTLDEVHELSYDTLTAHCTTLLQHAGLSADQMLIEPTQVKTWFKFEPSTTILDALRAVCTAEADWKIDEMPDGTVVIGAEGFEAFQQAGLYHFSRNRDVFSREIIRDDASAYRRVCAHNADFSLAIYRDVDTYVGWNLQAKKTLYVAMPDGVSAFHATRYASEIATLLKRAGRVETFVGPFRPQIEPGDAARVIGDDEDLGVITEVVHRFGKSGFTTEFTVDSGGRFGRGRLSDYLKKITRSSEPARIGYEVQP